ncbi:TonB-dependent receptor plug domain-containing protein [Thiomicrospira microaerophila]|uniref:TonB-dependent receptor plug domain-containing protein n=1 Tax=Thiomicrospira microaerophila TaxID=406020 RepID=UPI0005CA447C|nr:TonB-dependent receptor plug domain-containing protein [Thiomicrospira microaerophila]
MCLTLRLKPIAALCCVSLLSPVALAGTQVLDKITITSATKTERTLEQTPVSVEVIDEQAIKAIGATTFADILRHSEGVFMNPDQRAMSIRGVSAKGVLLLIDGRRVASEFTKNYDAGRIPVASIERVEIIKGPMAALYGSDALGGVINIITKNPQDGTESSITVSGGTSHKGEAGQMQVEADVRGRAGARRALHGAA